MILLKGCEEINFISSHPALYHAPFDGSLFVDAANASQYCHLLVDSSIHNTLTLLATFPRLLGSGFRILLKTSVIFKQCPLLWDYIYRMKLMSFSHILEDKHTKDLCIVKRQTLNNECFLSSENIGSFEVVTNWLEQIQFWTLHEH